MNSGVLWTSHFSFKEQAIAFSEVAPLFPDGSSLIWLAEFLFRVLVLFDFCPVIPWSSSSSSSFSGSIHCWSLTVLPGALAPTQQLQDFKYQLSFSGAHSTHSLEPQAKECWEINVKTLKRPLKFHLLTNNVTTTCPIIRREDRAGPGASGTLLSGSCVSALTFS